MFLNFYKKKTKIVFFCIYVLNNNELMAFFTSSDSACVLCDLEVGA